MGLSKKVIEDSAAFGVRILPLLGQVARAVSRNPMATVEYSTTQTMVDAKGRIHVRHPILKEPIAAHITASCGIRGQGGHYVCGACAQIAEIKAPLEHEIGHLVGESFTPDPAELHQKAIDENLPTHLDVMGLISKLTEKDRWIRSSWNFVEDVRVNLLLIERRPGMAIDFDLRYKKLIEEGVRDASGEMHRYTDMEPETQIGVAYCLQHSGCEEAMSAINQDLVPLVESLGFEFPSSSIESLTLAQRFLAQIRANTPYFPLTDEPEEEQEQDEKEEQEGEPGDSGSGEGDESQEQGQQQEHEQGDEGGESEEGDDSDGEAASGKDDDVGDSSEGSGDDDGENDGSGNEDDESGGVDDTDNQKEQKTREEDRGDEGGEPEDEGGEVDEPRPDNPDGGQEDSEGPEGDPGDSEGDSGGAEGNPGDPEGDSEGSEGDPGDPDNDSGGEPGEGRPGQGEGEGSDNEEGENSPVLTLDLGPPSSDPEKSLEEFEILMGNDTESLEEEADESERDSILAASALGSVHFNVDVAGIAKFEPGNNYLPLWPEGVHRSRSLTLGFTPQRISESQMNGIMSTVGGVKASTERLIDFNRRSKTSKNRDHGKLQSGYGRKVATGDFKVFYNRSRPDERSIEVAIVVDVSSSTHRMGPGGYRYHAALMMAAIAQAELLGGIAGVKFSLYIAAANKDWSANVTSLTPVAIKEADDPCDIRVISERLHNCGQFGFNLDGSTLRLILEEIKVSRQKKKLIIYFTDGQLCNNDTRQQTKYLQEALAEIELTRGMSIVFVPVGSDAPTIPGVECTRYDSLKDLDRLIRVLVEKVNS